MPGPAPGARCSVCRHPDVPLINHAYSGGASGLSLAKKYGFGKDTILRHFNKRHPGVPDPKPGTEGASRRSGVALGTTREQLEEIRDALRARVLSGNARTDEMRELRLTVDQLAKMSGEDRPKSVSFRDVIGMDRFMGVLFEELEPFPSVRERIEVRLRKEVPELFNDSANVTPDVTSGEEPDAAAEE